MSPVCRHRPSPSCTVTYLSGYQMDLNDLKPSVRLQDRVGYIYHTTFRRPTDGRIFHYIGQRARTYLDRRYFGSGMWLKRLEKKYGRKGNIHVALISWAASQQELDALEVHFIAEARRLWPRDCINFQSGGLYGSGATLCDATRRRQSKAHLGQYVSPETRAKISAWNKGRKRDAIVGANVAKAKKAANESKPIGCCPHCGRTGRMNGGFISWHFDSCGRKPTWLA